MTNATQYGVGILIFSSLGCFLLWMPIGIVCWDHILQSQLTTRQKQVSRRIAEFILLVSYQISRISDKIDRLCPISVNVGSLQFVTNSDTNLVIPHLILSVSRGDTQAWLSGLRCWFKSPVRNSVGSNPTAVKYFSSLPYQQFYAYSKSEFICNNNERRIIQN